MEERSPFLFDAAADAICAAAVVFAQFICVAILWATALYAGWLAVNEIDPRSFVDVLELVPYVGTIVTGRRLWRSLRDQSRKPFAHALFLGFSLASMLFSLDWFKDPMHDLGMIFDSHGRWGCGVVNPDGSAFFLLRDRTVPFMLFVPILVVTAGHWLATRRAR